jgi:2-polyprenyl-6-methoxyphenol hydroxylase-like FAD-dependent oxidoreductase
VSAVATASWPADPAALPAALRAYEQARRARVERIVKAGARSSSSKTPGPVGRRFQEAAMSLVFRYVVTERSTAWMTGSRLSWDDSVVA